MKPISELGYEEARDELIDVVAAEVDDDGAARASLVGRFAEDDQGPERRVLAMHEVAVESAPELGPEQRVVEPEDAAVARGGPEAQALALTP